MRQRQRGVTLIELMVALAIGSFLMIGALTIFVQGRTTFRVTESISRLQENARFALDVIEPEIRMAHYWGLTSRSYLIQGRAGAAAPGGLGPASCGNNWSINLDEAVEGSNNGYGWACAGTTPAANTDALVIRRASEDALAPAALTAGTLYIQSTRSQFGQIFAGTAIPASYDAATSETHRLIVNGYYVSTSSSIAGMPSLRRKTLRDGGVRIDDEEVLPGIEDLQIQFGVDTDLPGTPVAPNPNRGAIDRYVDSDDRMIDPDDPLFDSNAEVLAVRIWLRVRAERDERGFTDAAVYQYADQNVGPFNDGFRRVVVSKTIYLRNARPAS